MKVHFSLFSSESTRLVRLIKSENPDNQVIIRIYSYPDPIIRFHKADNFPTKQSVNLLVRLPETLSI